MKWFYKNRNGLIFVGSVMIILLGSLKPAEAAIINQAPIADAGASRYAATDPVQLDGTGSYDLDNSGTLSFFWQQITGPSVVITDANTATPTISGFVQSDEIQECEFELIVSDGELTSLPDTVKVIIVLDFGASTFQQENPPFDPNKPTVIYFYGGDCRNGFGGSWTASSWKSRANLISFPSGYRPDGGGRPTYYKYGDMIIVYLSASAPDYKQPIQTIGASTGGMPATDVGLRLNRIYRDARYAVNRVTHLEAPCRLWSAYLNAVELYLTSSVDGEQCWIDHYYGAAGHSYEPFPRTDILWVRSRLGHDPGIVNWYRNSLISEDMNKFNSGVVGGAYWSVAGPGKNLQLAPDTNVYYFNWDGSEQSGSMDFYDEVKFPGRLPEPVTLVGPEDGAFVDANGVVFSCEESENAVGYQLLFGPDPYHMVYLFSDTAAPPNEPVTAFPFEQGWWTVKVYDSYGSTIYADPVPIYAETVSAQAIENEMTGQRYASIQQAINDARPGEMIVVSPGAYQYLENINFKGRNLTIRSIDPNDPAVVAGTLINGGFRNSAVTFSGGEEPSCVLDGFTITGGIVGISCDDACPTIRNCTIESNSAVAIEFWNNEPAIIDCTIFGEVIDRTED